MFVLVCAGELHQYQLNRVKVFTFDLFFKLAEFEHPKSTKKKHSENNVDKSILKQ